jgi:hypothetical protein
LDFNVGGCHHGLASALKVARSIVALELELDHFNYIGCPRLIADAVGGGLRLIANVHFDVAEPILLLLRSHPSLHFVWQGAKHTQIGPPFLALTAFLKATETLEHLSLSYFDLTRGHWDLFVAALQAKISRLSMSDCKLDAGASNGFIDRMSDDPNTNVRELYLRPQSKPLLDWYYIWERDGESLCEYEIGCGPLSRR